MNRIRGYAVFAIAVLFAGHVLQGDEPFRYSVAGISQDSEKFSEIYLEVAVQDAERRTVKTEVKILEHLSEGLHVVLVGKRIIVADLEVTEKFANGVILSVAIVETEKVYQYVTKTGSVNPLQIFKKAANPIPMSRDEFVTRLKGGESFLIQMGIIEDRCQECRGFGKVKDSSPKRRAPDGKVVCPKCRGEGFLKRPKMFRVQW